MKRKIAFISHESPLAILGGVDAGGQVVYVDKLTRHLAHLGYEIDIFTRWEDEKMPQIVNNQNGIRVIHIKAGPVKYIRKEKLLPYYQNEFTKHMLQFIAEEHIDYALIHANFF